jgi:hypothetical protein
MLSARLAAPIEGAQWSGIVSRLGVRALESDLVDAVLCVQQSPDDRFTPLPVLARTPAEVLAARVNKPTLSPNLRVLEQLPGSGIRRLLAIGVGCQVQALRAVQATLPLDELYVLGLPCVDNVSRQGLQTFLNSASRSPASVNPTGFAASSDAGIIGVQIPGSASNAMTSSTVSSESAPRSSIKLAPSTTLSASTPRCSRARTRRRTRTAPAA